MYNTKTFDSIMCTHQKYNEGTSGPSNSSQTVKSDQSTAQQADYYPGAHVSGHINHPPIPAHVLGKDIELKDTVALMQVSGDNPLFANVMLNAVYGAFALGLRAGVVDCSNLPTVTMPLTAVRDPDHRSEQSELELVQSALAYYRSRAAGTTEYESNLIDLLLEGLTTDMHDLIGEMYALRNTSTPTAE